MNRLFLKLAGTVALSVLLTNALGAEPATAPLAANTPSQNAQTKPQQLCDEAMGILKKSDYLQASNLYRQAILLDPKCDVAFQGLGWCHLVAGELPEALNDCDTLLQLNATNADTWLLRAETVMKLGQAADALTNLDTALSLYSTNDASTNSACAHGACFFARAQCHQNMGEFDTALRDIDRAIELAQPGLISSYDFLTRAWILWDLKRRQESVKQLDAALLKYPNDPNILSWRGYYQLNLGRYKNARSDLQQAAKLTSTNADVCNQLAWFYATCPKASMRKPKLALSMAQFAAAEFAGDQRFIGQYFNTLDTLAAAYAETGDFKNAVTSEEKAISVGEGLPPTVPLRTALDEGRNRLSLYKARKPYRVPVLPAGPN